MDTITELVGKTYPVMTYALSAGSSSVTDQLSAAVNEKVAIINVLSSCTTNVSAGIDEISTDVSGYKTIYSDFGVYNSSWGWPYSQSVTTGDPGTIDHWCVDTIESMPLIDLQSISSSSFSCSGDETSRFPSGSTIFWLDDNNAEWARIVVRSAICILTTTFVTVSAEAGGNSIPGELTDICSITHSYDVDDAYVITNYPEIPSWCDKFVFALDHLTLPLNSTSGGTYGINAKVGALSQGSTTIDANKTKQDQMDEMYREFTTWTPITTAASYESDNSFLCPGDVTSILTSGTELLIDMDTDNETGAVVSSSEYIPEWRNSYTEATVVIDVYSYMYSPETSALPISALTITLDSDLVSVSVSTVGGLIPLSGATYVDPVTIIWPGDITSTIPSGSVLVCEYPLVTDEDFSPRYFSVYYVTLATDYRHGKTLVTIGNNLPLTENLWEINTCT